jgi:transcriptional regulator of aromatic amino acid metabolism
MFEEENQKELLDEIKKLNTTHEQMLMCLNILVQPIIEKRLAHIFSNSEEVLVYKNTDGTMSSRKLGDTINVSHTTVTNLWEKWAALGIVEKIGVNRPYKAKYSIVELSINYGKSDNINSDH